ncbi:Ribonuclease H [Planoprotostelium fungivorum]|uniref:ribonuclease H n=1 Tax=Planoprotostelium fungivorum TaxID=1890364 RepID=A0A2P6NP31_9EUKA|nr:Ribonuclease H [Planoprotostelium fungivorum]
MTFQPQSVTKLQINQQKKEMVANIPQRENHNIMRLPQLHQQMQREHEERVKQITIVSTEVKSQLSQFVKSVMNVAPKEQIKRERLPVTSCDEIEIWTDGSCEGNPGPGGWGFIVLFKTNGEDIFRDEGSGYKTATTNNQMELMAAISALQWLQKKESLTTTPKVKIMTDSKYVLDGITSWIKGWKNEGWKLSTGKPVKNMDLWMQLDDLHSSAGKGKEMDLLSQICIEWVWVKGHSGVPENEEVDQLAKGMTRTARSLSKTISAIRFLF